MFEHLNVTIAAALQHNASPHGGVAMNYHLRIGLSLLCSKF